MSDAERTCYVGGRVFTADRRALWAEALVFEAGRIIAVGDAEVCRAAAGARADLVDVGGALVMPGFVDAHAHILMTGDALERAQLRTAHSLEEIRRRLRSWAVARPGAPRVLGTGWLFDAVPNGEPTRQMLDDLFPDRPVLMDSFDLHAGWVNSAALAEMGITRDTPDPVGGEIRRDAHGEPTGLLLETALHLHQWRHLSEVATDAQRDGWLRTASDAFNAAGTTTAVDMALDAAAAAAIERSEADGALTLRVLAHWIVHRSGDPEVDLEQVREAVRRAERHRSDMFRVVGIKVIVDGTIDACTAALHDPYANGTTAEPIWPAEALRPVVLAADAAGLQIACHAIGDRAVRIAIDALEEAALVNGRSGARHRIEHLEYVDPADVPRLGALGITASMQPVHADPAIHANWAAMLGEPRASHGFAWRDVLAAGATLAFGTDTPTAPHESLHNMYIAATRRSPGDPAVPAYRPEMALPLDESVVHGTADAAWASFAEGHLGVLAPGAAADLIVVDADPFAHGPEALLSARVLRTVLGGRTVHG